MELRHLRQAVAVSELGTFSRAAVSLNLSQSALTRGIQALEEQVGVRLFERNHDGVEPTSAGKLLLKRARSLLSQVEELEAEMGRSGRGSERPLRVAAGPYAAPLVVIPAIGCMWQRSTEPRIELEVTPWSRAIRLVRQGRADLAVAEDSEVDPHGLEITKLCKHPVFAVVRAGHSLDGSGELGLDEVFRWPLAFVAGVPVRLSSRLPRAASGAPFSPSFRCEDLGLAKKLVASTDLVALLPLGLIEEELTAGSMVAIPLRHRWMATSFSIMRLNGQDPSETVSEMARQIVEADQRASDMGEELADRLGLQSSRTGSRRRRVAP